MLLASACRADIGLDAAGATDDAGDMVIAIVGDAGERNDDTLAVASLVASTAASAVFTVGDNEYTTEGRTVGAYEESVGEVYGRWVDDGAFFPIPGDHDYGDRCDDPDEPADLDAYLEYFDLPLGPEDETYYDVRIGDVHVFALDAVPWHATATAAQARSSAGVVAGRSRRLGCVVEDRTAPPAPVLVGSVARQ
ncbi:MAG: hypothetical protein R2713_15035 [Ilumatobacteraceae bacterium]